MSTNPAILLLAQAKVLRRKKKKPNRRIPFCSECSLMLSKKDKAQKWAKEMWRAKFLLINGAEERPLCKSCLEDEIVDMVLNNYGTAFYTHDEEKGKLQIIEVS